MNTKNNRRSKSSREAIENAFIKLLDNKDNKKSGKITVQAICNLAEVNRTTFYAHYTDIYDLQNKIEERLSSHIKAIFQEVSQKGEDLNLAFHKMFSFIREYKAFYKKFLMYNNISVIKEILGSTDAGQDSPIDESYYHISFFTAGISEIARIWLNNGCRETPEALAKIIYDEYRRI